jgi:hypothetical protein
VIAQFSVHDSHKDGNLLRRFKKTKLPYDPLAYRNVKRFAQDEQPHAQKCQCKACQQYTAVITRLNPSRITEDEDSGIVYARNAQVRTPEDIATSKSRLKWNNPNRPYELANRDRSSALWRGGVYTQVRTAPDYSVTPEGKIILNHAPAPTQPPLYSASVITVLHAKNVMLLGCNGSMHVTQNRLLVPVTRALRLW